MLYAYRVNGVRLELMPDHADLRQAVLIDLLRPTPEETAAVNALGVEVPTLADMEEIEISNRLYREGDVDYMTAVLPGRNQADEPITAPACFILTDDRLVTVRHHSPRPFETYPARADKLGPGCTHADHVFLGLMDDIVGRLADLLEGTGRALDTVARKVHAAAGDATDDMLQEVLHQIGSEAEQISRVRLALMTIERMISWFGQHLGDGARHSATVQPFVKGVMRDLKALEVHADFLSGRVQMITDVTLGMIQLSQGRTIKIVSVVAVVFLPPTVIASAYGMNFEVMPELQWAWGYPMALVMMLAAAVGTYLFFKWKKWL